MKETASNIEGVELTKDEKELYDKIFSVELTNWGDDRFEIFEVVEKLTISLINRKVIPQHRIDYFTQREYQLGRTKKIWYQIFE